MREVIYHPAAEAEVVDAVSYYETQREGLGFRFLGDFERTIQDVRCQPEAWPVLDAPYRRHQFIHFPYGVIYRILPDAIRVLAVMHLHQKPGYWKSRVRKMPRNRKS